MLHEILENIPFDSMALKPDLETWLGLTPVKTVFDTAMARVHGRDRRASPAQCGDDLPRTYDHNPTWSRTANPWFVYMQKYHTRDGILVSIS